MNWFRHRLARLYLLGQNVFLAFDSLRDRWFRSALTIAGVFIGVVIIVGVASVLNGFRQNVISQLERFGSELIAISRMPAMRMGRPDAAMRLRKHLTLNDAEALRDECPALSAVSPMLRLDRASFTLKFEDEEMMGPIVQGSWPEMKDAMALELSAGRFFTHEENQRRANVCIIGANAVKALFPGRRAVGRHVSLNGRRLLVIGAMEEVPNAFSFGGENPDDSLVIVPYSLFHQLFPWNKDVWIFARAHADQRLEALEQIEEVLRRRRRVPWKDENDFGIMTPDSILEVFDKITGATVAVMFALSSVAFLVGGVGVMNVMLASVKERTREIGIRRAIGARRRDITWQFLVEAMALTGVGGLLGVTCGEGLMLLIAEFLPQLPNATPMWARLFGFLGSVGVGLVFGLWPAITAARLDPIEALHYE